MKQTAFIFFFCFIMLGIAPALRANSNSVGLVRSATKDAHILRNEVSMAAEPNMKIMNGDVVSTGPQGSLGLVFDDDTIVSMGPDSEFVVEDFLFNPSEKKLSLVFRVFQGTFSFLSGQIAKLLPDAVRLETPEATIGLRGTHVLIQVKGDNHYGPVFPF